MKILVLGGYGFVGSHVMETLLDDNFEVNAVSRTKTENFDLLNLEEAEKCFYQFKPDYIVNCAAQVGSLNYVTKAAADIIDINLKMILNLYKAVNNVCSNAIIINPIGNCAYPGKLFLYGEDQFYDGNVHPSVLAYGTSRRTLVVVSETYEMQYGLKTINLIVPNMYGPYDSTDPNKAHALNALISKTVKAIKLQHEELNIWGTGVAIREWLYAGDFARIVSSIIKGEIKYGLSEPVNIAQNFGLSVKELVEIIVKEAKFQGTINWDHSMPDGAPKKVMDDTRFKKIFPQFLFTNFVEGIHKTIKFYESCFPY